MYSLKKDDIHKQSVAVVRPKEMSNYYQRHDLINQRVIMMTQLKAIMDILLACQRCALVSSYSDDEKEEFYVTNSKSLIIFPKKNKLAVKGDFNGKIGKERWINCQTAR